MEGTRGTQQNPYAGVVFSFGLDHSPFRFFLFLFDLLGVFHGPIGPGTSEVKTLRPCCFFDAADHYPFRVLFWFCLLILVFSTARLAPEHPK